MPNPVDFSAVIDAFRVLPNRIKFLREQVLALDRGQFTDEMKRRNILHEMSTETLRKLEREGDGSTATVTRVLNAINALLKEQDYEPVTRAMLLAPWESLAGVTPAPTSAGLTGPAVKPKLELQKSQTKQAQTIAQKGSKTTGKTSKTVAGGS
jgi:hypothetical protein